MPPKKTEHEGLDQLGQATDQRLDLALIEVGDLLEHLVEITGALADGDHLDGHPRKDVDLADHRPQSLARLDLGPDLGRPRPRGPRCRSCALQMSIASIKLTPEESRVCIVREKRATPAFCIMVAEERRAEEQAVHERLGPLRT